MRSNDTQLYYRLNSSIRLNESLQADHSPVSVKSQSRIKTASSVRTTTSRDLTNRSSTRSRASTSAGLSRKGLTAKTEMPFVVGKSTGKSFHVPSNIQKAVALINKHSDIVNLNQSKRTSPHKKAPPKQCEKHPHEFVTGNFCQRITL
jgi:hypothetical protein